MRRATAITVAVLGLAARAGGQSTVPSVAAGRVAAQVALGTVAAPVAFIAGGLATRRVARAVGASDASAKRAAYAGAYASVLVTAAALPAAVGSDGRVTHALAGSALGMVAALGVVKLGNLFYDKDRRPCGVICWTLGAVVFALPATGATIAYNRSRR